jgi:hypothetical protein
MIDKAKAEQTAMEWVDAWNAHDIDAIMHHYADDVDFYSPLIVAVLGDPSGHIKGKDNLKAYFLKGLAAYPDLHFSLHSILQSPQSVAIHYTSVNNWNAIEVMVLNEAGKVQTVYAHY